MNEWIRGGPLFFWVRRTWAHELSWIRGGPLFVWTRMDMGTFISFESFFMAIQKVFLWSEIIQFFYFNNIFFFLPGFIFNILVTCWSWTFFFFFHLNIFLNLCFTQTIYFHFVLAKPFSFCYIFMLKLPMTPHK